jgi:hypothetical protein
MGVMHSALSTSAPETQPLPVASESRPLSGKKSTIRASFGPNCGRFKRFSYCAGTA